MRTHRTLVATAAALVTASSLLAQSGVGWTFTYQGQLNVSGQPANASFDLQFKLFDAVTSGAQVGPTVTANSVAVSKGLFTQPLDFGSAALDGHARWLEIAIKPAGQAVAYTVLTPRQPLTPAPYARGLSLPYSGNFGTILPLVSLTQTSTGDGISFSTTTGTALYGQTSGGIGVYGYNLGPSGNAGFFRTESSGNASPALVAQGGGSGPGVQADSSTGIAGRFDITNGANNQSVVQAITAGTGRAGTFQNTNPNNTISTIFSTTVGTGNAIAGLNTGYGQAGSFQISNAASNATALRVQNDGNGAGLYVVKPSNTGSSVLAVEAADPTATALNVVSGSVRCQGAGLNTNTWVFHFSITEANRRDSYSFYLNNPQCNGKPGAMIFVQPAEYYTRPARVYWDAAANKWVLHRADFEIWDVPFGEYNIMSVQN